MRILDRYLLRHFSAALAFCLVFFALTFIVIDAFNNLDEFLKSGVSVLTVFAYYLYLLPTVMVQIVPIAVLVALLFTLGNFSKHNEILALKASGVSALHILSPYLFVGVLISFCVLLANETVVPKAAFDSKAIKEGVIERGKKDLGERALKNVTTYGKDFRMFYAREFEISTNTLYDVVVLEDNPNQTLKSKLTAKKAGFRDGQWWFEDAVQYRLNRRGDLIDDPVFTPQLYKDYSERPEDFLKEASQVEFMNTRQLKEYIDQLKGSSRRLVQRLAVEFHYKIAFPFVSFFVMLLGAPLAMRTDRSSAMLGVGTSLFVVLFYYGLHSVCLALGKNGTLPAFLAAWLSNFLFAGVGLYLIRRTS